MDKTAQHGGARAGAGRKKGSTASADGYKSGRIVICCLENEVLQIKELAAKSNKTVSRFIIDTILQNK